MTSASQRDQLLAFVCTEYGVDLPDLRADTVRRRLEDPDLPDGVKLLLALRLESSKTSTAKYKALVNAVSSDGRLRNTMQFAGASRTGRWAHRPSMLDKSATTSFLPGGATMQPRTALAVRPMTLSNTTSA